MFSAGEGHYIHDIAYIASLRLANKVQHIWDLNAKRRHYRFTVDPPNELNWNFSHRWWIVSPVLEAESNFFLQQWERLFVIAHERMIIRFLCQAKPCNMSNWVLARDKDKDKTTQREPQQTHILDSLRLSGHWKHFSGKDREQCSDLNASC